MNNGLYAAYLGMRARQRTLEIIASNLANASTVGFKGEQAVYHSIEAATLIAQQNSATVRLNVPERFIASAAPVTATDAAWQLQRSHGVVTSSAADYSQGAIRETGRSLDVALEGDGFLVVQTARGERYTRAGSLTLDADGQLVTQRGELIVGDNGPITLQPGQVTIAEDGTVTSGGQRAGRLRLVRFNDPSAALIREGDNLFALDLRDPKNKNPEQPAEAVEGRVVQGALEMANVNPMSEMAAMIANSREFDSLQRSLTLLMNDVGRKISSEIGRL